MMADTNPGFLLENLPRLVRSFLSYLIVFVDWTQEGLPGSSDLGVLRSEGAEHAVDSR